MASKAQRERHRRKLEQRASAVKLAQRMTAAYQRHAAETVPAGVSWEEALPLVQKNLAHWLAERLPIPPRVAYGLASTYVDVQRQRQRVVVNFNALARMLVRMQERARRSN